MLRTSACKPALFLDRDGVINFDYGYVHTPASFDFIPGIFDLCRRAIYSGYLLVIVTNQAGIARGFYSEDDFASLSSWMTLRFQQEAILISGIYYSPYHPLHGKGRYLRDSPCRKPGPGMLLQASLELGIDLSQSLLIGDKITDIQAGSAAGLTRLYLYSPKPAASNSPNLDLIPPHKVVHSFSEISFPVCSA